MPLVQIMERADLSWRDRERIAAAINACNVQWESMEKERQQLNQQRAQGQAAAAEHLGSMQSNVLNAMSDIAKG